MRNKLLSTSSSTVLTYLASSWLLLSLLFISTSTATPSSSHDSRDLIPIAHQHGRRSKDGSQNTNYSNNQQGSSSSSSSKAQSAPRPRSAADLVLTDIVIVTTVEGSIYGLDRVTGEKLWELPAHTSSPSSGTSAHDTFQGFGPLIRSTYGPQRSSFVELLQGGSSGTNQDEADLSSADTEYERPSSTEEQRGPNPDAIALLEQVGIYVVEPSSAGDIYLLSPAGPASGPGQAGSGGLGGGAADDSGDPNSSDPLSVPRTHLSKLPLTLPQLVQLSPFSFAGDDSRIFIGHKSTTLVELDIATGSIGAVWGGGGAGGASTDSAAFNSSFDFDDHSSHPHHQQESNRKSAGQGGDAGAGQFRPWTYIGRTDYTLTIHARNRPSLSQTLHFSTYAPTAADLDIQALWSQAGHPDHRAVIGTGEQQTVICFNTTNSRFSAGNQSGSSGGQRNTASLEDGQSEASTEKERTVWKADVGGTIAGIFDVVQPLPGGSHTGKTEYRGTASPAEPSSSSHSSTTSERYVVGGTRPVIVPHPPVSLASLFGANREVGVELGMPAPTSYRRPGSTGVGGDGDEDSSDSNPLFDPESMGMTDTQRPAYLGFSGGSLFAMGSNKFPLAAFSPRAAAGLPGSVPPEHSSGAHAGKGGSAFDGTDPSSSPSDAVSVRPCSAFGCWLGSYPVEVDAEMDGNVQDALLGRRPLGIADRHEDPHMYWEDRSPRYPGIDAPPPKSPSESDSGSSTPRNGSAVNDTDKAPESKSGYPTLMTLLLQVAGLGCITLFSYAFILGLNEQQRQSEERSNAIAEQVEFCSMDAPYVTDEQANLQLVVDPATGQHVLALPSALNGNSVPGMEGQAGTNGFPLRLNGAYSQYVSDKPLPAPPLASPSAAAIAAAEEAKERERERERMRKEQEEAEAELARKKEEYQRLAAATDVKTLAAFIDSQNQQSEAIKTGVLSHLNGDGGRPGSAGGSGANGKQAQGAAAGTAPGGTPSKRRRRGKRAGAAVAAKAAARAAAIAANGGVAPQPDDDDGEDEDGGAAGSDAGAAADAAQAMTRSASGSVAAATEVAVEKGRVQPQAVVNGQTNTLPPSKLEGSGLTISEDVLGYGSSGTVVFKGTFQGRAVAVKRLLRDFVNVASKEVSLLESADNHPNVIRYFYKELTGSFLYIALELCPASLADVIDKPSEYRELHNMLEPKQALRQITSGVRHLHSLHIVHRDIKPQNILVAVSPNGKRLKMLLSDFGLSKRLDGLAQTSFSQTVNNPGGTVGWRAPEILRGDVQLDPAGGSESEPSSMGVHSADGLRDGTTPAEERKRLTRAVDIFAYILANGEHPFGSRFEREMNIIRNCKNLSRLDGLGEEGVEAQHLINAMIAVEPRERPSAPDVLSHPYFWDAGKRLNFLQEASDRFEIMERDPPAPPLVDLEAGASAVLGSGWYKKVDKAFLDDLGKFRKYDGKSVQDLLRAMRNKKHHYQDLSPHLKKLLGPLPGGFLSYFTRRFPLLFMHVHTILISHPLIPFEAQFREYFEPNENEH
ncbi:bifunctional endoribonuclease/protein kinase ire1 [Tilletia horrida]|nr:bifunctional endoribonuclease/protein kinase ire1 [Tilletia horrida]